MSDSTEVKDNITPAIAERRRHVIQYCALLLGRAEDQMPVVVHAFKDKVIHQFFKKQIGPVIGVDYFHWRVDRLMWSAISDAKGHSVPFPYDGDKKPDAFTQPLSMEYKDACDRRSQSASNQKQQPQSQPGSSISEGINEVHFAQATTAQPTAAPAPTTNNQVATQPSVPNMIPKLPGVFSMIPQPIPKKPSTSKAYCKFRVFKKRRSL